MQDEVRDLALVVFDELHFRVLLPYLIAPAFLNGIWRIESRPIRDAEQVRVTP